MNDRFGRHWAYRAARRTVIAVIGGTVVLLGIAMLVLPGPGLLTILGGLAVLGIEFAFARRWLKRAKDTARQAARKARERIDRRGRPPGPQTEL